MPSFSSDGRRLRAYSVESAEHLEGLSLVAVRRNKQGVLLAMHFRDGHGGSPLRGTCKPGQRYSSARRVSDTSLRVWSHAKATLEADRDQFQRVVLDQMEPLNR